MIQSQAYHLEFQFLILAVKQSCQDAEISAWSTFTCSGTECGEDGRKGGVSGRGQSRPVYLLFSSGLMAQECLALLNWALRTHTAALKLPDGW